MLNRPRMFSRVDLPLPDGPRIADFSVADFQVNIFEHVNSSVTLHKVLGYSLNIDAIGWWVRVSGAGSQSWLLPTFFSRMILTLSPSCRSPVTAFLPLALLMTVTVTSRSSRAFDPLELSGPSTDDSGLSVTGVERR